jgi:hypothetical protein
MPGRFEIGDTVVNDPEKRVHRIKLIVVEKGGRRALVCEITLFGGATGALTQITPLVPFSEFSLALPCLSEDQVTF